MKLNYSEYLSEVAPQILEEVKSNPFSILKSPTGSGKSYAILNDMMPYIPSALFLCPVRTLVDNLESDYPKGYGKQWAESNKLQPRLVTTYDTGKMLIEDIGRSFNTIYIDEAHLLAGHANFRKDTLGFLAKLREAEDVNVVLVTATPEALDLIDGVHMIDCERKSKPLRREVKLTGTRSNAREQMFNLIHERKKDNLLIIRHNNKELIDEIAEKHPNLKVARLYSDNDNVLMIHQDEGVVERLRKGDVPKEIDVLLTTSIIDAGISLKVHRDTDIYGIPNDHANVIHPIDVLQLAARVRSNSKFSSTIEIFFRGFGEYELPSGTIQSKGKQLIDDLGAKWEQYTELNREVYVGLLGYYNLIVNEQLSTLGVIDERDVKQDLRNISIYRTLILYPDIWRDLINEFDNDMDWIAGCMENGERGRSKVKARKVANQLIEAKQVLLHPNIFATKDSYFMKRANNLISASNELRRNSNSTLRKVLESLLEAFKMAEVGDKISYDRTQYHELDDNAKGIANEFSRVLFDKKLSRSEKLIKRKLDGYEDLYLSEL